MTSRSSLSLLSLLPLVLFALLAAAAPPTPSHGAAPVPTAPTPSPAASSPTLASSPAVAPPTPAMADPFHQVMDLMSRMMQVLTDTVKRFTASSKQTVQAIGTFGDRIVYTERLIDDMGTQIGWMADKIVATEQLCADLTRSCFCPSKTRGAAAAEEEEAAAVPVEVSSRELHGDNPWTAFLATMDHALQLMDQMSLNITTLLDDEVTAIGVMGDRIVGTECLIMDMGKQIGVMADRIVYTEHLMANASRECCGGKPQAPPMALTRPPLPPTPAECQNYTAARAPTRARAAVVVVRGMQWLPTAAPAGVTLNPWTAMVEKLIDPMMDEMAKMMTAMAADIVRGTEEIGALADDIVDTEHLINAMGMEIGRMADCIVAIEHLGLAMVGDFCAAALPTSSHAQGALSLGGDALCPPIKPVHPVHGRALAVLGRLNARAERWAALHAHVRETVVRAEAWLHKVEGVEGIDPARDFAQMVKLCRQFLDMMGVMAESVGGVSKEVMDGVKDMAGRIVTTMGLMDKMAGEINTMAGRIVKTADLLAKLADDCGESL